MKRIFWLLMLFIFADYQTIIGSEPFLIKGRYYNSTLDYAQHTKHLWQAFKFLCKKILWPQLRVSHKLDKNSLDYEKSATLEVIQSKPKDVSIDPIITWIGHASFLIQIGGYNILTDPVFGNIKMGPFNVRKRIRKPGVTFNDLSPIHAIVISHNHADHVDTHSLRLLRKKWNPRIIAPMGTRSYFKFLGFKNISEHSWWQELKVVHNGQDIKFNFLPAYHWSMRFSPFTYRKSLWGSWMITHNNRNIYFGGDTAYGKHFKEIAKKFPHIDIALMPIGPTCQDCNESNNKLKVYHVDARQSVQAFLDLQAQCFFPMHYGTFGDKTYVEYPVPILAEAWRNNSCYLEGKKLCIGQCGKPYSMNDLLPYVYQGE